MATRKTKKRAGKATTSRTTAETKFTGKALTGKAPRGKEWDPSAPQACGR